MRRARHTQLRQFVYITKMTQFVVDMSKIEGIMFIYCRFLFEKFNLFKLIFSSEMSSSRSLSEVQVRIDLSLLSLEPQISKANNTNNCHLKFKFTDYFNNCSKNPFVKSLSRCLKITQYVSFEFLNFGTFHQFLSY